MNFTFRPRIDLLGVVPRTLLEEMHGKALDILGRVGIKVTDKHLLRRIAGHRGFMIEEGWVKVDGDIVEGLLLDVRRRSQNNPQDEEALILSPGYPGCSHVIDLETNRAEPLTTDRVIEATKLIDTLYDWGVRGDAPGGPVDVPPKLRRIAQCKIGYEYCRSAGPAPFESYEEAVYIKRMADVMGQGFGIPIYVISPLRLEGISLERAIPFLEGGECSWVSVSSMPMAGATAPVYPIGAFIQGIAEGLGGYAILSEAYPSVRVGFGINAYQFDMRYGSIVMGSPEYILMQLFSIALNAFYGEGLHGHRSFRTMSKRVDFQAQVEKAASATVGVLTGPGAFAMSGKLSLDEVFSPVQLVIDCEIARYLTRLVKGLDFTEDQMEKSIGAMDRCAAKGHYFTDETTLSDHKRIYWAPTLFDHALFHTARGEVDIMARAKDVCVTKIREHSYELGEDKKRKLEKIYAEAANNLA